jgi:hypothetical protein
VRAVSIDGPDTLPPWARRPTLVSRLNETIPPNFLNLPAFAEGGEAHVVETPRGSRAEFALQFEA